MEMTKEYMKERLYQMNRDGSYVVIESDGDKFTCLVDSWIPLKIEGGKIIMFWKEIGYDCDTHATHTTEFVKWVVDDFVPTKNDGDQWVTIMAEDERGRKYTMDAFNEGSNPQYCKAWKSWEKYKRSKKELFDYLDKNIIDFSYYNQ